MGGKPKTSTPRDMRLKRNNPNAGRPAQKPAQPQPAQQLTKKGAMQNGRS